MRSNSQLLWSIEIRYFVAPYELVETKIHLSPLIEKAHE